MTAWHGKLFAMNFFAMRPVYLTAIFYGLILISSGPIGADEITDFQISQDFSEAQQHESSIAVGLNGHFAVLWVDDRSGQADIYCRLFDSGAVPIDNEFVLNDDGIGAWQLEPDLSSDWYGNYFAVWKDYRNGSYPFDPDVYYQKLDSVGFVEANKNITIEHPDSSHQSPAIGATGWGKSIVAWTDLREYNWDIYMQSLDNDGNLISGNIQVNDDISTTPQHEPDVALSPEGWFVIAWYDRRNGNDDIYIQKFDSSGAMVGSNIKVNSDNSLARQKFPSVAIGGNGVVYVVWTDWRNGTYPANSDIFGQRFDSDLNRLEGNIEINRDNNYNSQRDPQVASDRMGNVCVVWSDSTFSGWNARGQMIEFTGNFRDNNFAVNLDLNGDQLMPDVALDGYNLYMTWSDNRNGDFDTYGRVTQYNDPTLIANPRRIDITRDKNDPPDQPIMVTLTNAGYGELNYRMRPLQSWLNLSSDSGMTTDSFVVTIDTDSLDYGMHQGQIQLIDLAGNDSSTIIPVIVTVTGPMLSFAPEALLFNALIEMGSPSEQNIIINNIGSGSLNWSLSSNESWITFDQSSGSSGDMISVGCDLTSLSSGDYIGYLIATDVDAINSPESLEVLLTVISNIPFISASVDNLFINLSPGGPVTDSILISNLGGGELNWRSYHQESWMTLSVDSGQSGDYLPYTIESDGLTTGYYIDSIIITDTVAYNNPLSIPVDLLLRSADSIIITPVMVETGSEFQSEFYLQAGQVLTDGVLIFNYDNRFISVDSFSSPLSGELSGYVSTTIDSQTNQLRVQLSSDSDGVGTGRHFVGDLYGTANDSVGGQTIFDPFYGEASFFLKNAVGEVFPPEVSIGPIDISISTGIEDEEDILIPTFFSLDQNWPNPFNSTTVINYSIPRQGYVRIELFNILGQTVKLLVDDWLLPGQYSISWNGRNQNGRDMASGIYFYRLTSDQSSSVRKMVLLK